MLLIIKLIFFCISNVGFWEMIRRNTKINVYFFPSLTIAVQTTVLFLSGILNLLKEMTGLLYGIGIIWFIYCVYRDKGIKWVKNYINIGFVFLAIASMVMLIFMKGKIFTHYDNFSHWAIVVKTMIETNRYPNFEDTLIMFQEYPLGSATYIYFFVKLVSTSESIQMFAQTYMILSCIIPLFVFNKKNKISISIVVAVVTNFFLVYNISVTDLLVDTLLPIVAVCGFIYAYNYCQTLDNKFEFYSIIFYTVWLIQIKNSGIFFVSIICLWILINIRNDKKVIQRIICTMIPFLSLIIWQKHCKYVFVSAASSKHAMTIENYKTIFGEKTIEDICTICFSFLKFAATWKDVWLTIGIIIIVGFLVFMFAKNDKRNFAKLISFSIIIYMLYQIGMLGMYLFSMPISECAFLAGSNRYSKTILVAVIYLTMVLVIKLISDSERKIIEFCVTFVIITVFMIYMYSSLGDVRTAIQYRENPEERVWIETAKKDYGVLNGESYCILIKEKDSGYAYYLGKYIFQTNSISSIVAATTEDLDNIDSKYIFVYDQENKVVQKWIQNNYPEQYGNSVIVRENE